MVDQRQGSSMQRGPRVVDVAMNGGPKIESDSAEANQENETFIQFGRH